MAGQTSRERKGRVINACSPDRKGTMVRCMFFRFAAMAIFSFSPLSRAVLIRVISLLTRVSPKPGWPLMKFGRHAEFSRPCRQTLNITGLEGRLFTFPLAARRGLIACPVRVQSPADCGPSPEHRLPDLCMLFHFAAFHRSQNWFDVFPCPLALGLAKQGSLHSPRLSVKFHNLSRY